MQADKKDKHRLPVYLLLPLSQWVFSVLWALVNFSSRQFCPSSLFLSKTDVSSFFFISKTHVRVNRISFLHCSDELFEFYQWRLPWPWATNFNAMSWLFEVRRALSSGLVESFLSSNVRNKWSPSWCSRCTAPKCVRTEHQVSSTDPLTLWSCSTFQPLVSRNEMPSASP